MTKTLIEILTDHAIRTESAMNRAVVEMAKLGTEHVLGAIEADDVALHYLGLFVGRDQAGARAHRWRA